MRCNSGNMTEQRSTVRLVIALVMTLLVLQGAAQQDTETPGAQSASSGIQNQAQTISKARRLFGLPDRTATADAMESPTRAVMVTPVKDNTPYLSDRIAGRQIWRVEMDKVKLRLPSAREGPVADEYERTFDVFLHQDGHLLKVVSRWPAGEPPIPPEPHAESTTDQIWRSGEEVYHAFPDEPPPISFIEALDGLASDIGNVLVAKQIKAQYVLWSKLDWEPRPMWVITLRGIPPFEASYPGVPVHARDHLRFIVDPETGQWVQALSTPQPETSENTRFAFAGGVPPNTVELYLDSPDDGQTVPAGQSVQWDITAWVGSGGSDGLSMISVDLVQNPNQPQPLLHPARRRAGPSRRVGGVQSPGRHQQSRTRRCGFGLRRDAGRAVR